MPYNPFSVPEFINFHILIYDLWSNATGTVQPN